MPTILPTQAEIFVNKNLFTCSPRKKTKQKQEKKFSTLLNCDFSNEIVYFGVFLLLITKETCYPQ